LKIKNSEIFKKIEIYEQDFRIYEQDLKELDNYKSLFDRSENSNKDYKEEVRRIVSKIANYKKQMKDLEKGIDGLYLSIKHLIPYSEYL